MQIIAPKPLTREEVRKELPELKEALKNDITDQYGKEANDAYHEFLQELIDFAEGSDEDEAN